MSPLVPDSSPPPDKPLPPPPALPFPTLLSLRNLVQPPSDLDLDQRSWEHVRDLAKQSLKNVKEGEEVWLVSWIACDAWSLLFSGGVCLGSRWTGMTGSRPATLNTDEQ